MIGKIKSTFALIVIVILLGGGCKNSPRALTETQKAEFLQIGKEVVMTAQGTLGKNLMTAMQKGGPEYAVGFCSEKSISLTDSLGNNLNVQLRRVSDKNRNPDNRAVASELEYIIRAKTQLSQKENIQPEIVQLNGKIQGYYPIITNDLCKQCHGNPDMDISYSTLDLIAEKYPNDKAIGYGANQLRGIWVVEF
jgi:hypothetical protein